MADIDFEGSPRGMAQASRAQKLWSRVKRVANSAIALATPDSRKANNAPAKAYGAGDRAQSVEAKTPPKAGDRRPDVNKILPTEKQLPSLPYDKEAVENRLQSTADKFVASQAKTIAEAFAKMGLSKEAPPPPIGRAEPLSNGAGAMLKFSAEAMRHPAALRPGGGDRSNGFPGGTAALEIAQAINTVNYRGAVETSVAKGGRIITLGQRATAVNISLSKATMINVRPSTEFSPVSRNASVSSMGSVRSFDSTSSGVSAMSTHTDDTSMSIHSSVIPGKAQSTNEGRKPASELYEASRHTPQHGR